MITLENFIISAVYVLCILAGIVSAVLGVLIAKKDKDLKILGIAAVFRGIGFSISYLFSILFRVLFENLPDSSFYAVNTSVSIVQFALSLITSILILVFLYHKMGGKAWIFPVVLIGYLGERVAAIRMNYYWYIIRSDVLHERTTAGNIVMVFIILCAAVLVLELTQGLVVTLVSYKGRSNLPSYSKISVFFAVVLGITIMMQFSFLLGESTTAYEVTLLTLSVLSGASWVVFEIYLLKRIAASKTDK